MITGTPQFIGYIRVSGRSQVEGDGPARQEDSIRAFANVNRLHVSAVVNENGVSGTVEGMDRPVFSALIARIEELREQNVRLDGIIVERMDRLARDLMVSEMLLKECRERGIKVLCADRGLDNVAETDEDPTRVLIRQVLGALSQWEKSALVIKLRKSRERKKAATGRCEGQKPFGTYQNEQRMLEYVKASVDANYVDFHRLSDELNVAGFRNRRGKLWRPSDIKEQAIRFAGWVDPKGQEKE